MKEKKKAVIELVCKIEVMLKLVTLGALAQETYEEKRNEAVDYLLSEI